MLFAVEVMGAVQPLLRKKNLSFERLDCPPTRFVLTHTCWLSPHVLYLLITFRGPGKVWMHSTNPKKFKDAVTVTVTVDRYGNVVGDNA